MWKAKAGSGLVGILGTLLLGCSGAPSMDMDGPIPTSAESICNIRHPCPAIPGPEPEEVELCHAVFADMKAECRSEGVALFVCSMRASRCDASGDIDDEATFAAIDTYCTAPRGALERCCDKAGGDNVHCGLYRDEGEALEDDYFEDDADDAGDSDASDDD